MINLFTEIDDLKIAKVEAFDVLSNSDNFLYLKILISEHQDMYPGIEKWFKDKVIQGLKDGTRIAYLGFINELPMASAIVKLGMSSKFCHLHIKSEFRNQHIGDILFSMMALDVKRIAKQIHFTLPEGLWSSKAKFFQSFGFEVISKAHTQYRSFEDELKCQASFKTVLEHTLLKLPLIIDSQTIESESFVNGLLLSLHPKYCQKILEGTKKVEIRKRFDKKWKGRRITLYSTAPNRALVGHAVIKDVITDNPEIVWEKYSYQIGATYEEFKSYVSGSLQVNAIILDHVTAFRNPVFLSQLEFLTNHSLIPPQSFSALSNSNQWAQAVFVAELLNGKFKLIDHRTL